MQQQASWVPSYYYKIWETLLLLWNIQKAEITPTNHWRPRVCLQVTTVMSSKHVAHHFWLHAKFRSSIVGLPAHTAELGLSLSGDSLSCSGVWRVLALWLQDHSGEDEDGEDDKWEVKAEGSEQPQLVCCEGEQHCGPKSTPEWAEDEEDTGTSAWADLGFVACTTISGLVLDEDDGEGEVEAAAGVMKAEEVDVAAETALEERDRVGLRLWAPLLWLLPLPEEEEDRTVRVCRGCCVCVFSWKGTVAFMGSRRPSKFTPAALIPGDPLGLPAVTPGVGDPFLRTLWDILFAGKSRRSQHKHFKSAFKAAWVVNALWCSCHSI